MVVMWIYLMGLLMMAFSILIVVLKMSSLNIAVTLFVLGLILVVYAKNSSKKRK